MLANINTMESGNSTLQKYYNTVTAGFFAVCIFGFLARQNLYATFLLIIVLLLIAILVSLVHSISSISLVKTEDSQDTPNIDLEPAEKKRFDPSKLDQFRKKLQQQQQTQ